MNHFENRTIGLLMCTVLLAFGTACGDDDGGGLFPGTGDGGLPFPGGDNPILDLARPIAEACGIDVDCEGGGIAEGNASISGVAQVDAFFQSVINFQAKADAVSAGIDAEVKAIAAGFGVAGEADLAAAIEGKIAANVDGGLTVVFEEPKCQVDAAATLEAKASCEGEINPGSAMIECKGSCEVEASADVSCSADAQLRCTFVPPSGECSGECSGKCEVDIEGACEGTCRGSCSGECELVDGQGNCAGKCDGMCTGRCEAAIQAECSGSCTGECTLTEPQGGCEGAIRAECKAMAEASVMCEGKCEGEFEPPSASVECEASAKAEARLNVECTPPRVAIDYSLNAELSAEARAEFLAGLRNLEVRLPSLLAKLEKAELVAEAGADLVADGSVAVEASVRTAFMAAGDANMRVLFGLNCAIGELGSVGNAVSTSSNGLAASIDGATGVVGALGM
ncbi:MAG: hypothetical protein OXU20_13155 [Myxococcales bacterium]|nr:hypothetical protein [Myxococcales bacterium]